MGKEEIIIYRVVEGKTIFPIVPLNVKRKWMTDSFYKFAYKCLPLNIANQYGFAVLSPTDFAIDWKGGKVGGEVAINVDTEDSDLKDLFKSYFGEGTFTLHPDFFIRTPRGYSTYIRGIPNETKPGVKPLDAIVETDWLPFTFTYSFLLTEPGLYNFKKGEPLFCFFPIKRNTVENFKIKEKRIENADSKTRKSFKDYEDKREAFISPPGKPEFQNFYRDGTDSWGNKVDIKDHTTNLVFGKKSKNNP
jgi:hypothetical protein